MTVNTILTVTSVRDVMLTEVLYRRNGNQLGPTDTLSVNVSDFHTGMRIFMRILATEVHIVSSYRVSKTGGKFH